MSSQQGRAIGFGVAVHLARFGVIVSALQLASLMGVSGWYLGLCANVACTLFAVVLVTRAGLWRTSGLFRARGGRRALVLLLPLAAEPLLWALPHGLVSEPPGYGLWALTLLLVGLNEELVSRVVVLERQLSVFAPLPAVTVTAALFGLQHLSALVTTDRALGDVLLNVLASACYGFVLASYQSRFHWLLPLVAIHAAADFTTLLAVRPLSDATVALTSVAFVAIGLALLHRRGGRWAHKRMAPHSRAWSGRGRA